MKAPVARSAKTVWNFQRMENERKVRGLRGSAAKEEVPAKMLDMPKRAKEARKRLGLTQDQVASAGGVSQTAVSNLERGDSLEGIRVVVAVGIAKGLGMSLEELVLGTPNLWPYLVQAVAEGKITQIDEAPSGPGSAPASDLALPLEPKPSKRRQPRQR